jgi:hypothetical protein
LVKKLGNIPARGEWLVKEERCTVRDLTLTFTIHNI